MRVLLMYDISEDNIRNKVMIACEDYGLDRLQYSTFSGELSRNHQEELMLLVESALENTPGRVQLVPVGAAEWNKRIEVGCYE